MKTSNYQYNGSFQGQDQKESWGTDAVGTTCLDRLPVRGSGDELMHPETNLDCLASKELVSDLTNRVRSQLTLI